MQLKRILNISNHDIIHYYVFDELLEVCFPGRGALWAPSPMSSLPKNSLCQKGLKYFLCLPISKQTVFHLKIFAWHFVMNVWIMFEALISHISHVVPSNLLTSFKNFLGISWSAKVHDSTIIIPVKYDFTFFSLSK